MRNKPVGGRGKKAAYKTVVVRVPVSILGEVNQLIDAFYTNKNSQEYYLDNQIYEQINLLGF